MEIHTPKRRAKWLRLMVFNATGMRPVRMADVARQAFQKHIIIQPELEYWRGKDGK